MPDRAEVNSAIVRCRTRVVPLRTVNKNLKGAIGGLARGTEGLKSEKPEESDYPEPARQHA
jgi:hypothetical protein